MRRAAFAVLGTLTGSALLVGTKLGTSVPADPAGLVDPAGGTATAPAGSAADPGNPAVAAGPAGSAALGLRGAAVPGASASGAAGRPAGAPAPTTPGGAPRTTAPPPPPPAGGLKNGSTTGTAVTERYGTVQVTIVVTGGRMTDVSATYPTSPSETQSINARAIPKLRQEALTAQSASIATVSGATYTSNAYKTSLQAALDAARV